MTVDYISKLVHYGEIKAPIVYAIMFSTIYSVYVV